MKSPKQTLLKKIRVLGKDDLYRVGGLVRSLSRVRDNDKEIASPRVLIKNRVEKN